MIKIVLPQIVALDIYILLLLFINKRGVDGHCQLPVMDELWMNFEGHIRVYAHVLYAEVDELELR